MLQNRKEQNNSYNLVDVFKWVMAILVVMLHACPLLDISELADYCMGNNISSYGDVADISFR